MNAGFDPSPENGDLTSKPPPTKEQLAADSTEEGNVSSISESKVVHLFLETD